MGWCSSLWVPCSHTTHTGRCQPLLHQKSFPSALGHMWFQKWQRWHLLTWNASSSSWFPVSPAGTVEPFRNFSRVKGHENPVSLS